MRNTVIILFFCCYRLFAQVGPPDLRCSEVLQSGDVKLTWIPPPDPSNAFSSYQVFYANAPGGPYTPVGIINSIGTNTFVHAIGTASSNIFYYYVVTSFNGGLNGSTPSDTISNIVYNLSSMSGYVDLKMSYNNIHQPKLPASSPTFTINKEYPVGTWSVLGITPDLRYADTLSVCNALLSYQVLLADNSGCISKSCVLTGTYTDTYRPGGVNGPLVDSISVLPDGSTIIAWEIPRDKDIIRYQIYYRNGPNGIVSPTAAVIGRPSTSYHYTLTTADSLPISLFVAAIDSCSNDAGIYNGSPITMFLRLNYNQCLYKTQLNWNRYRAMPGGILEYRIYYSSGNGFVQVGSTQDTTFTHPGTAAGKNVCYYIRVFNNSKTISASSNRVCLFTTQVQSSAFVYIKSASVIDNKSVQLRIFVDTAFSSNGLDIFRSSNNSSFSHVGFVPYTHQPQLVYTDPDLSTGSQSYMYKIVIKDECGNPRANSNVCKTMLLKVQDNGNIFNKHLSWNPYEGFNGGVRSYNVYRVINDAITEPLGTTAAGVTTYVDDIEVASAQGAKIEYLVQAEEGAGNMYGIAESSNSNPAAVYMEGSLFIPNAFAPNGHNKTWRPVGYFIDKTEYSVTVFNRWGLKVFDANSDDVDWDGKDCVPDVYVYLIRYKTSTGEYKEIKGTVLLLE